MKNIEMVKEYLLENLDDVRTIVSDLNSWSGCLEHLEVWENDEDFFDMMFDGRPMEAVRAAHYGEYNYTDDYVRVNDYGNLESFDEWQYEKELQNNIDEIIDNLIENQQHCYLSDELETLLNEEEEEEE